MSTNDASIPVVLFAYARTAHLARVLGCLRENRVPLLEVFADGPKDATDATGVAEARAMLHAIDWCDVRMVERPVNVGLGRNVLSGVSDVATRHQAFIVWEDDLIAVPGTYAWLCATLRRYAHDERVMSVTAWTHPRVTPADIGDQPYFDGRAECWVWGSWSRSWKCMTAENAAAKRTAAAKRGLQPDAYGADLPAMAKVEEQQNIWAVRWLYHHFQHGGLCVRPPWSMVEHIGFDPSATNAQMATAWANPPLRPAPPIPGVWPEPVEHPKCRSLWQAANPSGWRTLGPRARALMRGALRRFIPTRWRRWLRRLGLEPSYRGDYARWSDALRASRGYADPAIVEKVVRAARAVRDGRAAWDRDTVLFQLPEANERLLRALQAAAEEERGQLHVIDFGGALGSTWWQHRLWLETIPSVRWSVIEQPALVAAGQREFTIGPVRYFASIEECCAKERAAIVLLSSVLPYLEDPHALLREIGRRPFRRVIIDRTGFVTRGRDRLTVQRVPPSIYDASYPCWFFDQAKLIAELGPDWRVTEEWTNDDYVDIAAAYRGMVLERNLP
jgi:putative methyltransferase (TIGR04325 family)